MDVSCQTELLKKCSDLLAQAKEALKALEAAQKKSGTLSEGKEQAEYFQRRSQRSNGSAAQTGG